MSVLSQPHFHDEAEAYKYVEAILWPNGPICPHCEQGDRIGELKGKSTRTGVRKCYRCRKPFTVKIGTVFESSNVPMTKWLQAVYLLCSSKKGISSNQLGRTLGVQIRTAWFMSHRIREAMRADHLSPLGGLGKIVEADETFIGKKQGAIKAPNARGYAHKQAVLSLVERGGEVRSFQIDNADTATVRPIVEANIARESMLMTDEAKIYGPIGKGFKHHFTVEHGAGEYVRGSVHTNTLESYYSVFKRGMKGTYQHCAERHLHRYVAEFDFRHNLRTAKGVDDETRSDVALRGIRGRRLTYKAWTGNDANNGE